MIREMRYRLSSRAIAVAAAVVLGAALCFPVSDTQAAYADDADMSQLQSQIESTAQDYDTATAKSAQLQQQIQDNQARLDEINEQLPDQMDRSADAVRALYVLQQEGYNLLNMVLSSESIGDFLQRVDYIDCIQQHSTAQVQKLTDMKSELETTQAQLDKDAQEASEQADRAQRAMEQAVAAREQAQQKAAAEAAQQAAAAQAAQQAAVAAAQGSAVTASQQVSVPAAASTVDWSLEKTAFVAQWTPRIDAYLAGSPLAGTGADFAADAWNHGVDPRWSPAISAIESSKGAACANSYNAWGWTASGGGFRSFGSWEEAIDAHTAYLARVYGSTLTQEAAKTYAGDPSWYSKCAAQMDMI